MFILSTNTYSFISLLLDIYNNVDIILMTIKKSLKLTVQTLHNMLPPKETLCNRNTYTHKHTNGCFFSTN